MDKEKEIEKMIETIKDQHFEENPHEYIKNIPYAICSTLVNAGYRKADEVCKEREEEIMSLTAQVEVLQSEKDNLLRTLEETGEELRDIRKETAKEIIDELKGCYSTAMLTFNHETAETLKSLFLRLEKEYEVD